jgi:hypothetical protein
MSSKDRPEINMSGIPVAGIGGLGLWIVALVMTLYYPEAWWLMVIGSIGGIGAGAALVLYRRHHRETGPSGDDPTILFRAESAEQEATPGSRDRAHPGVEELAAAR